MKNIILVGFMGTGKTIVAKALAGKLKLRYVSTDSLIEERERMSITDIFAKKGEAYFRDIEASVVADVSAMRGVVVDAGGGVVLRDENMRNLKRYSTVICLEADVDTILRRTSGRSTRPLLNVQDPAERTRELLRQRAPFYARLSIHIDTAHLTVEEVVGRIIELTGLVV